MYTTKDRPTKNSPAIKHTQKKPKDKKLIIKIIAIKNAARIKQMGGATFFQNPHQV